MDAKSKEKETKYGDGDMRKEFLSITRAQLRRMADEEDVEIVRLEADHTETPPNTPVSQALAGRWCEGTDDGDGETVALIEQCLQDMMVRGAMLAAIKADEVKVAATMMVCHPNRWLCCNGAEGTHCRQNCSPCEGDHSDCGESCLKERIETIKDAWRVSPEGIRAGVLSALSHERMLACMRGDNLRAHELYSEEEELRATPIVKRELQANEAAKSGNDQSVDPAEQRLDLERVKETYSKVASGLGTVLWMIENPWVVLGKFLWTWASSYWLVVSMGRRLAKAAISDVKGSMVVTLLVFIAYMLVSDAHAVALREHRIEIVTRMLKPENLAKYWAIGAPHLGGMLLDGFRNPMYFGLLEAMLAYVIVFTVVGWGRGLNNAWCHATIAKLAVPSGHLDRLALKRVDVHFGAAVFEKDEATGLFQKVFIDQTGKYQVRLIGFNDMTTSMAALASGRTLESAMPFSPVEKLGKTHTHTGSVWMNNQVFGMWFRVGNYFLTAGHVYEGMISQPKVLIGANGRNPLMMDVTKWKVARKGADLVALVPPMEVFTVLGVTSGKLSTPKSDEFLAIERVEEGFLGVSWGKLLWERWDGSTVGHAISTRAGCSGAPLVNRNGHIMGMHTHCLTTVEKGSKEALNFAIPSATLSIVLGLERRAESPRSEERRRVREQKIDEYEADAEREDEYEETYHDYEADEDVHVRTSKREHRYARGELKGEQGKPDLAQRYEKYHTGDYSKDMESGEIRADDLKHLDRSGSSQDFHIPAKVPAVEASKAAFAKAKAVQLAKSSENGPVSGSPPKASTVKTEVATPQSKPDSSGGVAAKRAGARKRNRARKSQPENNSQKSPSTDSPQGTAPPS